METNYKRLDPSIPVSPIVSVAIEQVKSADGTATPLDAQTGGTDPTAAKPSEVEAGLELKRQRIACG